VTGLGAGRRRTSGFFPSRGKKFFSFPKYQDQIMNSPSLLFNEYRVLFLLLKRPGHETDQLLPPSSEIKNE
jgi:hypothetical protein